MIPREFIRRLKARRRFVPAHKTTMWRRGRRLKNKICALWQKLLHIERVGVTDNFFELGGHSLLAVRLFAELEKMTGRKLPLVTFFQAPTVEELARLVDDTQAGRARSVLVPVREKGSRPPLFLVHGAGGDVLWGYANLAKHMPAEQPIYGIKSRGQVGLDEYEHIEDMARFYLQEVRALQPHGPYFLGGYCFGGNVAYEMARQLRSQGERVAQLLLIDASPSNAGYERITWWRPSFHYRFARNLYYWLKDFVTLLDPRGTTPLHRAQGARALAETGGESCAVEIIPAKWTWTKSSTSIISLKANSSSGRFI